MYESLPELFVSLTLFLVVPVKVTLLRGPSEVSGYVTQQVTFVLLVLPQCIDFLV